MEVIKANITHLDTLAILFDEYRVFYRKEANLTAVYAFLKERIEKEESVVYIAIENGKILGFTQLYPLFSSTNMKRLWLLNDLFVSPDQRGRGISKLLIERSKQLAKETKALGVSLETEKNNLIGNQLYPAVGFDLDVNHNYYFWTNNSK